MGTLQIKLATSDAELSEIAKLRYRIYVEELKQDLKHADHERKTLVDPLDCGAFNFYAVKDARIVGAVRANLPGLTDLSFYEDFFGFRQFCHDYRGNPDQVSIIGGFMILPTFRKRSIPLRFMREIYEWGQSLGVQLAFAYCHAHHTPTYERIGFQIYEKNVTHPDWGNVTLMVLDSRKLQPPTKRKTLIEKATSACDNPRAFGQSDSKLAAPARASVRPSAESRIRSKPWPTYDKGAVTVDDDEYVAANRVLKSKRLFRYDDRPHDSTEVAKLEKELSSFFKAEYALAVSSGTAALTLSLLSLGVGPGDEVLCSAFGFPASPSSIMLTGATPVLFEVDENLHPDLDDLRRRITSRTKAVLCVHMRGQSGDVSQMAKLCSERGLPLVEDAVPVLGASFGEKRLGTYGAFGAFSTQSDKSINCGEGGFLLTHDATLFERALALSGAYEGFAQRHFKWPLSTDPGRLPLYNFRMDEIRGAVCRSQLRKLPKRLETLRRNYLAVRGIVESYPELIVRSSPRPEATLGDSILFWLDQSTPEDAIRLSEAICAEGIDARCFGMVEPENVRCFWSWRFLFPDLSADTIRSRLPNSARWLSRTVEIPLSPLLESRDIADLEQVFAKVMPRFGKKSNGQRKAAEFELVGAP